MTAAGAADRSAVHALLIPDRDWPTLVARVRYLEELGVGTVWVDDHLSHPARPSAPWLDAWTALAGWAAATERVRLGTLVSSPVLRPPALLARQALSLAQLSADRFELGLGSGYAATDHAAAGEQPWQGATRLARFRDCLQTVRTLLAGDPVEHASVPIAAMQPCPPDGRRVPLTVAAYGPRALRLAAEHGDRWVSYGGFGLTADEHEAATRARVRRLRAECTAVGRDPATLRCALLMGSAATTEEPIWLSADAVLRTVDRYRQLGIDDFVFYYPPADLWPAGRVTTGVFEQVLRRLT